MTARRVIKCAPLNRDNSGVHEVVQTNAASTQVTHLLKSWGNGDNEALNRLIPLVLRELKHIAARQLRNEYREHTLQPTALVNEAYLRLLDVNIATWQDRAHFFAICAQIMRRILVEAARVRLAQKRGGDATYVTFNDAVMGEERKSEVIALEDALVGLAKFDQRKAKVVELRYFGGLSVKEVAHVLNVSEDTILRDWRLARRWLLRELQHES